MDIHSLKGQLYMMRAAEGVHQLFGGPVSIIPGLMLAHALARSRALRTLLSCREPSSLGVLIGSTADIHEWVRAAMHAHAATFIKQLVYQAGQLSHMMLKVPCLRLMLMEGELPSLNDTVVVGTARLASCPTPSARCNNHIDDLRRYNGGQWERQAATTALRLVLESHEVRTATLQACLLSHLSGHCQHGKATFLLPKLGRQSVLEGCKCSPVRSKQVCHWCWLHAKVKIAVVPPFRMTYMPKVTGCSDDVLLFMLLAGLV